jgi:hypothetical protein
MSSRRSLYVPFADLRVCVPRPHSPGYVKLCVRPDVLIGASVGRQILAEAADMVPGRQFLPWKLGKRGPLDDSLRTNQ